MSTEALLAVEKDLQTMGLLISTSDEVSDGYIKNYPNGSQSVSCIVFNNLTYENTVIRYNKGSNISKPSLFSLTKDSTLMLEGNEDLFNTIHIFKTVKT